MSNQKNKKPIRRFTNKMQANLLLVFCVVFLCFVALSCRLIYLEQENGERYEKRVLSQQTYVSNVIPFKRGDIVDRNNTTIATSEKVYNLIFDIKQMLEKEDYREITVNALTQCFDIELAELNEIIKEKPNNQYTILKKQLTYDEIQPFLEMEEKAKETAQQEKTNKRIMGVWFEPGYLRKYPLNTVGSDFLGFTFSGNVGNGGLEEYYNSYLNGSNGREYGYFDSKLNLERTVKPAVNGNSLILTVDVNVQKIVEKHIKQFDEEYGFEHMGVIVMNPNNGEVYAMAADGEYDLNNPRDLSKYYTKKEIKAMSDEETLEALNQIWRNYTIHDAFEPGSTIKPFTIAEALEEGLLTGNETYVCDGHEMVGGVRINCSNRYGHGVVTLEEALNKSCNDAIMQIVKKVGKNRYAKYQEIFNFGQKTGIDLVGEVNGIVIGKDNLGPTELATSSFGQSMTSTMIQVATGFSAIVNGGHYYEPHLVKRIENENGAVVETIGPTLSKEIISKDTSELLNKYLLSTVEVGTAKGAQVPGYKVGGKTGTAQKLPRGNKKYVVSFIGATPADDPEVVIYVAIDVPQRSEKPDDSSLATKTASKILQEILPFLEIYPDGIDINETTDKTSETNATADTANITEEGGENSNTDTNEETNGADGSENSSESEGEDSDSIDTEDGVNNSDRDEYEPYSFMEDDGTGDNATGDPQTEDTSQDNTD